MILHGTMFQNAVNLGFFGCSIILYHLQGYVLLNEMRVIMYSELKRTGEEAGSCFTSHNYQLLKEDPLL
jgi:hypothetical protein